MALFELACFENVALQEAKKEVRVKTVERSSNLLDQGADNAVVVFSGDKIYRVLCVGLELGHAKESLLTDTGKESDRKAIAGFCALSRQASECLSTRHLFRDPVSEQRHL